MTTTDRANAIIQDILVHHLPRVLEALERGYVDENQILVMYDHAVRARILRETAGSQPVMRYDEHEDALSRINAELEGKPSEIGVCEMPGKYVPQPLRGERQHAAMLDEANFHKEHVEKLACVCGGIIHDKPQFTGDVFLECNDCKRTFVNEFDLALARKTEVKGGAKFVDATYWTTVAGGKTVTPMETEISINGRKVPILARNGKFTISYEDVVRVAVNQHRDPLNKIACSDADLPMYTCTYGHRCAWDKLRGERSGSLTRGQTVECTPGMVFSCMDTGNA